MRTVTLILSLMLCSFYHSYAQGLIVTYEETVVSSVSSPDLSQITNPQIRAAIENNVRERNMNRERSRSSQLLVNNGISIYKAGEFAQQESEKMTGSEGNTNMNGTITRQFSSLTPHTVYKNHSDKQILSQANFEEKEYLIEAPLTEYNWKIGKRKKEISGFQCIEATAKMSNGSPITAWYTPDIPASDGPSSYWGLPGLILYLDINDGARVFSCTSIEQVNSMAAIDAPSSGEKISKAQFDKMVADFMQRLQDNNRVERGENSTRINSSRVIIK